MMSIDWMITPLIIIGIVLAIWAKISQQTITELLRDIRDFLSEMKEEGGVEVYE